MVLVKGREVILMRLIVIGLVAFALLVVTSEASACSGRIRNGAKAIARKVTHPFNGRFRRN